MKKLLPFLLAILMAFTFVSCDEPELPDFTVTFDGIEHVPVKVPAGDKFTLPDDLPVKPGYTLVIKMGDTVLVPGEEYDIAADTVLSCSWKETVSKVPTDILLSGKLENAVTTVFENGIKFEVMKDWKNMHDFEGYALSLNSEEEKAALFSSVKNGVEARLEKSVLTVEDVDGNVVFRATAELDPSVPPVTLELTDTLNGKWRFAFSYDDEGTLCRDEYFFDKDPDGNDMARYTEIVDGKAYGYSWEYLDASLFPVGSQIAEDKTFYSEGSYEISKYFNVPDFRLAESGTVISSVDSYDVDGKLKGTAQCTLRRAEGSDLIMVEAPEYSELFWAGDSLIPMPEAIAAPLPEALLDLICRQASYGDTIDAESPGLIVDFSDPSSYLIFCISKDRTEDEWINALSGSKLKGNFPIYSFSDDSGDVYLREDRPNEFSIFVTYNAETYKAAFDELFGKTV